MLARDGDQDHDPGLESSSQGAILLSQAGGRSAMKRLLTLLCGLMVAVGMKPIAQAPVPVPRFRLHPP